MLKRLNRTIGIWSIFFVGLTPTALAETITLETLPLLTRDPEQPQCPQALIADETAQPYQEGSYRNDGWVNLSEIATTVTITQRNAFSTTWVGTLKPPYQSCLATAGMSTIGGNLYTGHSYLRLQYQNSQVFFILDMTGKRDINGYTTQILETSTQQNNPHWTWGGSD